MARSPKQGFSDALKGSKMEHHALLALDRDGNRKLELHLQPPSFHASDNGSTVLLLHNIPVTASLSHVLRQLLQAETDGIAHAPPTSQGSSPSGTTEIPRDGIRALRVAYVVSEIHSYCLLLRCSSIAFATALKAELELPAAPGVITPVEFVSGEAVMREKLDAGEQARAVNLLDPEGLLSSSPDGLSRADAALPRDEACSICQVEPLAALACITTLCQHCFHVNCYAKLPVDSSDCPLCRFSLYDLLNDATCMMCSTYEDLWVCLICGFVGCGQGRRQHSREHHERTGHSCAMQSSTSHVWNYRTRMFLHQEVAVLAGEADDDGVKPFDLQHRSWDTITDSDDKALREALEESREEAVALYYTGVQQDLTEEQQRWFAEVRQARQAATHTAGKLASAEGGAACPRNPLAMVELDEQQGRLSLVRTYVDEVQHLMAHAALETHAVLKEYRASQVELHERIMLQRYSNSNLAEEITRLRERVGDTKKRGAKTFEEKEKKIAELQTNVESAFENLY